MTGGRLLRLKKYFSFDENFMLTYGDGLSSQNIKKLCQFHNSHDKIGTMTAVKPPARFGEIFLKKNQVLCFEEIPQLSSNWINGGFFILKPEVIDLIKHDQINWEGEPLELLAKSGELHAWYHRGFWQPMDTLRDQQLLERLWSSGEAPWKSWE